MRLTGSYYYYYSYYYSYYYYYYYAQNLCWLPLISLV